MRSVLINYWQNHSVLILNLTYKIILTLVVLILCKVISKILIKAIYKTNERVESFDSTLVPIISTFSKYLVYTVGMVIVLDIFGVNTASIITLLGTVGLAVGFALKDTLSNIAAGIMLLILKPFGVNDTVEYGSVIGKVIEINLFTTILETFDGLFISSPNGVIWGNTIKNYTRNAKRRLDVAVGISYHDSIDTGLNVLREVISAEKRFLKEPLPQVMVFSMGDSSVNLQVRGWVCVDEYWQVYWDLNKMIKEKIESAGLSIPFPQQDVHIINGMQPNESLKRLDV